MARQTDLEKDNKEGMLLCEEAERAAKIDVCKQQAIVVAKNN